MKVTVALLLLSVALLGGCSGGEEPPDGGTAERPDAAGDAGTAGTDLERAQRLLDAGDIPAAVEPLRRAARSRDGESPLPKEEIEFLLTQAEAASRPDTAEARIGEMRDEVFEAYAERGELPRVPYFHDPRIDAYFRKAMLARRPEAREIRERRRRR